MNNDFLDIIRRTFRKSANGYAIKEEPNTSVLMEDHVFYGQPKTLGELIKYGLFKNGMTQKALAEKVGTSQSRISEYMRGAVIPSLSVASKICLALKLDADEFVRICSGMDESSIQMMMAPLRR